MLHTVLTDYPRRRPGISPSWSTHWGTSEPPRSFS